MIALLTSLLYPNRTVIPSVPWAPEIGAPTIVLCVTGIQPYPLARVLEAIERWRSWGADYAAVIPQECDYEAGPNIGESWVDFTDSAPCNDVGCILGLTRRLSDGRGFIVATQTMVLAAPDVYDAGVIEHELGHALGLAHPCEMRGGFGDLPEGYHYCKDGEAAGNVMNGFDVSVNPWVTEGVREALRR